MKEWDQVLRDARNAHVNRHPDHKVWVGLNFVECVTCGAHAHIASRYQEFPLIRHDSTRRIYEGIQAEDF